MARVSRLWITLATLLCACVSGRIEQHDWIEVKSPNFTIFTDIGRERALALSADAELFRAAVMRLTNAKHFEPRVPTWIYAFSSTAAFQQFAGDRATQGYFLPGLRANLVAFDASGKAGIDARVIVFHEYTHFVVHNQNRLPLPLWYDEGFAEFMSTLRVDGQNVLLGEAPQHRKDEGAFIFQLSFGKILRTQSFGGWNGMWRDMFYFQSWQLVHYLMLGPGRQLGDMGTRLAGYARAVESGQDAVQAFAAGFGMNEVQLRDAIRAYHRAPTIPAAAFPRDSFEPAQGAVVRAVPPAEMAEGLGWLALSKGRLELAGSYYERALAADPARARAHAGIAAVSLRTGRDYEADLHGEQALELAPDDFESHLDLGESFHTLAEERGRRELLPAARRHYLRAIALAPDIPEGHLMLATTYLLPGEDAAAGVEHAERARDLMPGHTLVQLGLAQLYARTGRRDDAVACARRALLMSEGENEMATRLLAELGAPVAPASEPTIFDP
jgi:tetratricopeptide (TPR) repeat protein